jgi:lipid-binding SYLF domain-containing protein
MITRRAALALAAAAVAPLPSAAHAASASEINAKVDVALDSLLAQSPAARALVEEAVAVLVFPEVVKAGFGFGGAFGEGALRRNGATVAYYNIASASFGLQIGAQAFSEAYVFMTEDALAHLDRAGGFEVGADAAVAVASEGLSAGASSATVTKPITVFVYGQKGLMAGATIQGSKISRIHPK